MIRGADVAGQIQDLAIIDTRLSWKLQSNIFVLSILCWDDAYILQVHFLQQKEEEEEEVPSYRSLVRRECKRKTCMHGVT